MPGFFKKGEQFIVTVVTGPAHVYLGLKFGDCDDFDIQVVSSPPVGACIHGELDKSKIIQYSLEGVETANKKLDGQLRIAEIQYIKDDSPRYDIYRRCAFLIAEGVLKGVVFEEIA